MAAVSFVGNSKPHCAGQSADPQIKIIIENKDIPDDDFRFSTKRWR